MSKGYVAVGFADLHKTPDLQSEVVTQAKMGESLTLLERAGHGWWRAQTTIDGYQGYVAADAIREGDFAAFGELPGVVNLGLARNLFVNVYAGPKVQAPLLATLPMGARVACYNAALAGWFPVTLADGREGFIQSADLSLDGSEWTWSTLAELRAGLVRTARRFLGVPYRWGGTTAFGIDCSGLTQHVYALHGLVLPRDANQQARCPATRQVEREEAIPGDLLFFGNYSHVGLAVSHFEFIHATTHLDPVVQVSAIDDPVWVSRRDEVRRYVVS